MTLTTNFPTGARSLSHALVLRLHSVADMARGLDGVAADAARPFALPAMRVLLGVLFLWFGGLKIVGRSPVAGLVAQTLPFADPHDVLLVLGLAEVALGVLLMSGKLVRIALPVLIMHLAGTFATFLTAPRLMFSDGDPLLLTANGEFVTKNLVLIAATLVLICYSRQGGTSRQPQPGQALAWKSVYADGTDVKSDTPSLFHGAA